MKFWKPVIVHAAALLVLSLSMALGYTHSPNFIFILIDDMGWKDVGFMGNEFIDTPNIDRIANEGIFFTDAYTNAPNCAPTRACILTGQYMPRHGVYTVGESKRGDNRNKLIPIENKQFLPEDSVTVAAALKTAGYQSACIGMWNLGRGREPENMPLARGFDYAIEPKRLGFQHELAGSENRNSGGPALDYFEGTEYVTDRLTDEGIAFMKRCGNKPFFLYQAYHAVHRPYHAKPELIAKYQRKSNPPRGITAEYAATVEALDHNIGRIFDALEAFGQVDNTVIFFFSDNGGDMGQGVGSNAPLKGGKGELYEGGTRVPLAIWFPRMIQSGQRSNTPVMSFDFYPTMLDMAGVNSPDSHPLDGVSLVPVLSGSGSLPERDLFWHFPCYLGRTAPVGSMRHGDFKLIEYFEDGKLELFDLAKDIGETDNLVEEMPEMAAQLLQRMRHWRAQLNAPVPTQFNPDYDPGSARDRGNRERGANDDRRGGRDNRRREQSG